MWLVHIHNFDTLVLRPGLATRGVMAVAMVMVVVVVMMVGVIVGAMVVLAMMVMMMLGAQASYRSPRCSCGYYW